jgi:membrane-associated phospholipid phosphatase
MVFICLEAFCQRSCHLSSKSAAYAENDDAGFSRRVEVILQLSARSGRIPGVFFSQINDVPLWISIVVCRCLTPVWGAIVGVRFHDMRATLVVFALLLANAGYRQLRREPENPITVMIETAAAFIAFTAVWAPLSYLSARNSHALIDPVLSHLDHLMGFDWNRWSRFVEGIPPLNLILHIAYGSLELQTVVAIIWLPLVKGGRRGYELVRQGVAAIALTCILFWLFPALGAVSQADWTADVMALRGTAGLDFSLLDLKGIISFPSFHTILAILFIYAFRGTHLSVPAVALNLLMIISVLNVGDHYLTDVVAGAVVAAVSIVVVKWMATPDFETQAGLARGA